MLMTRICNIFL